MDLYLFSLLDPNPHRMRIRIQEENFLEKRTEKCKEIGINCNFIKIFKVNLGQLHFLCNLLYIFKLQKSFP